MLKCFLFGLPCGRDFVVLFFNHRLPIIFVTNPHLFFSLCFLETLWLGLADFFGILARSCIRVVGSSLESNRIVSVPKFEDRPERRT